MIRDRLGDAPKTSTESHPSDEELRNLAAIAELVDDSEEAAGARPEPPVLEQTPVAADPVVDWASVGAKLIAHAERVRERARGGGGKDWMSRFAECERDEEHEEEEEEEFPALKVPSKSKVTRYSIIIN